MYGYDAWGKCTVKTNVNNIATINPFRYRGYYFDSESNLYYLNARYYDPEIGRFISPDSTDYLEPETINGLNLYAYCLNNPVMGYDPDGCVVLSTILIMLSGALIGAAVSALSSIVTQAFFNNGEINWKSVAVAAVSGLINGALSASPLGVGWLMAAGGVLGVTNYIADSLINEQDITIAGLISSTVFGVISAKIGGNGANYKFALSKAISQIKNTVARELRRANQKYAQKAIARVYKDLKSTLFDVGVTSTVRFYIGTRLSMIIGSSIK